MCLSIIIWLFGLAGVLVFFFRLFDSPFGKTRKLRPEYTGLGLSKPA